MHTASITEIWIEAESWQEGINYEDDNSSIVVVLSDNSRWGATLHTYRNVTSLSEKNRMTGECLAGNYLWSRHMILVDTLTRYRVEEVVQDLIAAEQFEVAFERLSSV